MIDSLRTVPPRRWALPWLSFAHPANRLAAALPARHHRLDRRPRCEQCGALAWNLDIFGVAQCKDCARF